jgi:hypothetical protein
MYVVIVVVRSGDGVERAAADGSAADAKEDLDHVEAWNRRSG